ncbi:LysM peptidoglycan-binding domain-containing protein, partial [Staphylococcus aureus]
GEGTVENVNKLKQANGLSSNNISNGQKLIIPQ